MRCRHADRFFPAVKPVPIVEPRKKI